MDLASKLFKGDRVIWIIFMFLCLISVVEVFSATSTIAYKNANHWAPIVRHATFLLGGFVMVLLLHNIPCRFFSAFIILLPVSMLMLIVTPFIGVDANDAHRWLEIMGIRREHFFQQTGKEICYVILFQNIIAAVVQLDSNGIIFPCNVCSVNKTVDNGHFPFQKHDRIPLS